MPTTITSAGITFNDNTSQSTSATVWRVKTANYTASAGDRVNADTSSAAWTLTLPGSPVAGDTVMVADGGGKWATNNLTVARNGNTIEGLAENLVCDQSNKIVVLTFNGTTWRVSI